MLERLREFFRAGAGGPMGPSAAPSSVGLPSAPSAAVPRATNRAGAYEAGTYSRRTLDWSVSDPSANAATASAPTIRARTRDAVRNDAWAGAIVETLVDDVVGWGIKPLSRATNEPFRQALQALWDDWSAVADADGVLDLAGLQALAVREMVVSGECFIRLRRRRPDDGLPVPLQIQILPAECCPDDRTDYRPAGSNQIKQGIEFDSIGRRVAYWMRDVPPGEDDLAQSSATLHRVPADQVLHLFEPLRSGQRRGVSRLAPGLVRLRELDKYADATLLRLQLSTMLFGTLRTRPGADANYDALTGESISERADDNRPIVRLAPGTLQELHPDEELNFNDPPDPPVGFEAFVQHELRAAGAAVGVPFECFSHQWGATNDRLARVVLNQYRRRVHRLLWSIVVPQFLRPLYRAWYQLAVTGSTLDLTGIDARADRVTFAPHAHAYVHPVQDVTSYREAIRSGLTSRAAAVAETGEDVEVIDAQQAADNARADTLKLAYDSDARQAKRGAK